MYVCMYVCTGVHVCMYVCTYRNRRNFCHGLFFVNLGHTKKNAVIYSAHAHAMPLEIVLHRPE